MTAIAIKTDLSKDFGTVRAVNLRFQKAEHDQAELVTAKEGG